MTHAKVDRRAMTLPGVRNAAVGLDRSRPMPEVRSAAAKPKKEAAARKKVRSGSRK